MGMLEAQCLMSSVNSERTRVHIMGFLCDALKKIKQELDETGIDSSVLGLRVEQYKSINGGKSVIEIKMSL